MTDRLTEIRERDAFNRPDAHGDRRWLLARLEEVTAEREQAVELLGECYSDDPEVTARSPVKIS